MTKRFFVDREITEEGKYRVLQEDSVTKESFGVKDFDTQEEAQKNADALQTAVINALLEETALSENNVSVGDVGDSSKASYESKYKNTPQDLKDENSQE